MQEKRDEYLDVIHEQWENILTLYKRFEDKNPIMLFDIQEQRLYAYPFNEYKKELSEKSQQRLKIQFEEAAINDDFIVFIRDNEKKQLRSYSFAKNNRVCL